MTTKLSELDIINLAKRSLPVDLFGLAKRLGLDVNMSANLDPEISGQIERSENGRFKISINDKQSLARKRFTLAHEIGHFVLHRNLIGTGLDDNKAYRSTSVGNFNNPSVLPKHERQANKFAAELLLPADQVEHYCSINQCNAESHPQIARMFGVSTAMLRIRLSELGIWHPE